MLSINDGCAVPFKGHNTEDVLAIARSFRFDDVVRWLLYSMPCVNFVLLEILMVHFVSCQARHPRPQCLQLKNSTGFLESLWSKFSHKNCATAQRERIDFVNEFGKIVVVGYHEQTINTLCNDTAEVVFYNPGLQAYGNCQGNRAVSLRLCRSSPRQSVPFSAKDSMYVTFATTVKST